MELWAWFCEKLMIFVLTNPDLSAAIVLTVIGFMVLDILRGIVQHLKKWIDISFIRW